MGMKCKVANMYRVRLKVYNLKVYVDTCDNCKVGIAPIYTIMARFGFGALCPTLITSCQEVVECHLAGQKLQGDAEGRAAGVAQRRAGRRVVKVQGDEKLQDLA